MRRRWSRRSCWGTTNLSTTEGVRFTPSAAFETLTFTPEPGYVAHDYIVVLWEVAGGTLVPVRDYLVLAPSISIDT